MSDNEKMNCARWVLLRSRSRPWWLFIFPFNEDGRGLGVQLARLCGSFDHQPSERRLLSAHDDNALPPRGAC
jgi:hypothetical protein